MNWANGIVLALQPSLRLQTSAKDYIYLNDKPAKRLRKLVLHQRTAIQLPGTLTKESENKTFVPTIILLNVVKNCIEACNDKKKQKRTEFYLM